MLTFRVVGHYFVRYIYDDYRVVLYHQGPPHQGPSLLPYYLLRLSCCQGIHFTGSVLSNYGVNLLQ